MTVSTIVLCGHHSFQLLKGFVSFIWRYQVVVSVMIAVVVSHHHSLVVVLLKFSEVGVVDGSALQGIDRDVIDERAVMHQREHLQIWDRLRLIAGWVEFIPYIFRIGG